MKTIIEAVKLLPNLLSLKQATKEQIVDAENLLAVKFADEYKNYLSAFGAIIADGIELTGISASEHRNVVSVTKEEWQLNSNVPHTMYVVENTCTDGIVIWQDSSGAIYRTQYDNEPTQIAKSLTEYIDSITESY